MAAENKLSDRGLRMLLGKPHGKQKMLSDGRGLSVRVSAAGSLSFIFFYRIGGRDVAPVWLTLGKYPDMSLKLARERRDQCREWLADNKDPRIQLKIKSDKEIKPVTVRDAINYWFENYARHKRKDYEGGVINRFEKHIFPFIGDYPLEQCTLPHWMICFDKIKYTTPVMSWRLLADSKQALKFCRVRQYAISNVLNDLAANDVGKRPNKKTRYLDVVELETLWRHAFFEKYWLMASIYNRRIVVLCLVFGCRLGEARLAEWVEFDFDQWLWTVPPEHCKTGIEIVRPIPDGLKQWLVDLRAETEHTGIVLGEVRQQVSISSAMRFKWKSLGHQKRWSLHDFRRTIATHLNDMGIDFYVIEQLLGHALPGVSGIYNRSKFLNGKRDALNKWMDFLNGIVNSGDNVIDINKKVG